MDICKNCIVKGDIHKCSETECQVHNSWYVKGLLSHLNIITEKFLYLTDCNLATVSRLATLKRRPVQEYKRQIAIAQKCIDTLINLSVNTKNTRARDVIHDFDGSVQRWANTRR